MTGEAELLLSIFEWVEVQGCPKLLEGLCRLLGAVMKAAAGERSTIRSLSIERVFA